MGQSVDELSVVCVVLPNGEHVVILGVPQLVDGCGCIEGSKLD